MGNYITIQRKRKLLTPIEKGFPYNIDIKHTKHITYAYKLIKDNRIEIVFMHQTRVQ